MSLERKHERAVARRQRRHDRARRRRVAIRVTAGLAVGAGSALGAGAPAADASAIGCNASNYATTVASTPGILSYFRLGENPITAGTTTAVDEKGAHNGVYGGQVVGGQPGVLACDPNTAIAVDQSEAGAGYVNLPSLHDVTSDFTIEGWAKLAAGTTRPFGNNELFGSSGNVRLIVRPDGAYGDFFLGGTSTSYGTKFATQGVTQSNVGGWHLFDLVRSGSTLTLYRDGQVVRSATGLPTDPVTLAGTIGRDSNTAYPLDGGIDEVALYTQGLSAAQVQNHYTLSFGFNTCPYGCTT